MRCSYCYRQGHNRRTCPELKREIRENPDGYYARQEKRKEATRSPRKCSYCREVGHTKRTCEKYKTDLAVMTSKIHVWRQKFISICKEHGLGIGSLVAFSDVSGQNDWVRTNVQNMIDKHGKYGIVTGFFANRLDHKQSSNASACLKVRFPAGTERIMRLPRELSPIIEERRHPTLYIAAKINTDNLEEVFTSEWHDGTDTADWHLQNPHMIL